ncbi:helix-turn-helix domain-containing protein [Patescibacteria group bacterium]|nr:helix-turn-helix domain-containing protein [Patescibacteria group bacterium]MCL5010205.1 helix-turn-helix domain-containing protein [Patescibacteria group bacterium]
MHKTVKYVVMPEAIESYYPLDFRKEDAIALGDHLRHRHSIVLVGMKRVGISNFLRFFLNHKDIVKTYLDKTQKHLFIPVDLNDLIEKEMFPFWALVLKRIADAAEREPAGGIRDYIESLFLDSIQTKDLFFTIDNVRKSLVKMVESNILPTIFFVRFDRTKDMATPEFFANLQGLKDATGRKLAYVFTSFRSLDTLAPKVFTKASLSLFSKDLYVKPAAEKDTGVIYKTYKNKYGLKLSGKTEDNLFDLVDGYVQYLQLALIFFHETKKDIVGRKELFRFLAADERIALQSEELWDSLEDFEREILLKAVQGKKPTAEEKEKAKYLWDTGFVHEGEILKLFSPLFDYYVRGLGKKNQNHVIDFTKKENALFNYLMENKERICERENIINAVWPEEEALGVSDWAIDRLVARVRSKLRLQKSEYKIQTVKTRGYKLLGN